MVVAAATFVRRWHWQQVVAVRAIEKQKNEYLESFKTLERLVPSEEDYLYTILLR